MKKSFTPNEFIFARQMNKGLSAMKPPKRKSSEFFSPSTATGLSSKSKLLKSAETLFAAKGFRDVSVREIAAHAGVNSALVGYYFRGKQLLFNEVYRLHAAPLAKERMQRLAALTGNNRKPSVEEVLKAWIMPWLRTGLDIPDKALHVRMMANLSGKRWEHTTKAYTLTQQVHEVFVKALRDCLPFVSRETLLWRLHFIMGAITSGLRMPGPLRAFSKGRCDPTDLEKLFTHILPFAAAGFSAPEPETKRLSHRPGFRGRNASNG